MSNENIIHVAPQPAQPNPATDNPEHARNGKIARLPKHIREQLNRRLDDGQPANKILPWVNALPEVQEILADQFDGTPISQQNLSNWHLGGFQHWLQNQQDLTRLKQLCEQSSDISEAGGGKLAAAAATVMSGKLLTHFKNIPDEKINPAELTKSVYAVATLADVEQNAIRLENEKIRIQQRDEQLLIQRDKHQRDVIAIGLRLLGDERAKLIEAMPVSNNEKIEMLGSHAFGNDWIPRPVPVSPETNQNKPNQS